MPHLAYLFLSRFAFRMDSQLTLSFPSLPLSPSSSGSKNIKLHELQLIGSCVDAPGHPGSLDKPVVFGLWSLTLIGRAKWALGPKSPGPKWLGQLGQGRGCGHLACSQALGRVAGDLCQPIFGLASGDPVPFGPRAQQE